MDELDRITALEGPAFSGKTTLLRAVSLNQKGEIGTIPEGSEYVNRDDNPLDFDMFSSREAKRSLYFCLEVEKRRSQDAIGLLKSSRFVLMDRSIISNLHFYQLLITRNESQSKFLNEFLNFALSAFYLEVQRGNIFLPKKLVLLTVDNRQTFGERTRNRVSHTGFMSEWESYQQSTKIYDEISSKHYSSQSVKRLVSDNTPNNQQNLKNELGGFVARNSDISINVKHFFTSFLGKERPNIESDNCVEARSLAKEMMENAQSRL